MKLPTPHPTSSTVNFVSLSWNRCNHILFKRYWTPKWNFSWCDIMQIFCTCLGETFCICWITLPAEIWQKKWFGDKLVRHFQIIDILLFLWKNVMWLVYQILDICNYQVLFGLIYQKMVTCKCHPTLENYSTQWFISPWILFFVWLLKWKMQLGVT